MATLKTNTLTGTSTAGSIAVTGEGNSTTTNLQQGLAKCWVQFDGTASGAAARDSLNVSSMTDNGTGDYTININNDMANDDYSLVTTAGHDDAGGTAHSFETHNYATGSVTANLFTITNVAVGKADRQFVHATFHGDLA